MCLKINNFGKNETCKGKLHIVIKVQHQNTKRKTI